MRLSCSESSSFRRSLTRMQTIFRLMKAGWRRRCWGLSVSEAKLTPEPDVPTNRGPAWILFYFDGRHMCSKLQGHSKIGKNPIRHILATWSITQSQFEKISRDTVPLKRGATTVPPKRGRLRNYLYQQALKYFLYTLVGGGWGVG